MYSSEGEFSFRDEWCFQETKRLLSAGETNKEAYPIIAFSLFLILQVSPFNYFINPSRCLANSL
jgi:hypothetical protein